MALQVDRVELAARPHIAGRVARHHTSTSQTVETLGCRTRASLQDSARYLAQRRILREKKEHAPQVISKRPFVSVCVRLEAGKTDAMCGHLIKPPADEIR